MSARGLAEHRRTIVSALLVVVTVAVYAPVRHHGFVNYDDPEYVTENPAVTGGLRTANVVWAFTRAHSANWHPITWLSHMLDCDLYGLAPAGHHLTSVVLHAATSAALFVALVTMTGALWPSAWVAAMFALHPVHVESVAWISERKDVLCALFWMLALVAYGRYVRAPSLRRYAVVAVSYVLALMSKPMAVTLPLVLLLLDVWPLRRVAVPFGRAILEKLPLLVLTLAASLVTILTQSRAGAIASLELVPLGARLANATVAYVRYLVMLVWPAGLSPFYPLELPVPTWGVAGALVVLGAISALVVRSAPRRPYLLVGWLWYLVTLVPVIGIVRAGEQSMADRFTYIPSVGIFVMVAWPAAELARASRLQARVIATAAIVALVAASIVTRVQLAYWHDSESLFRHALAVTRDNYLAHTNLGSALTKDGRTAEAFEHFAAAVQIKPGYAKARVNLGMAYADRADATAAAAQYAEALRLDPTSAMAHYNWGLLLAQSGSLDEAEQHYREALRLDPRYAKAQNNLGWALAARGRTDEAIAAYREALRIDPTLAAAHNNLAVALEDAGRPDEALEHYEASVRLTPDDPKARFNFGALLAGRGRIDDALRELHAASRLAPNLPEPHLELARLLATSGQRAEAAAEYREVVRLAPGKSDAERELAALGTAPADAHEAASPP